MPLYRIIEKHDLLRVDYIDTLKWLRMIGDTLFGLGTLSLAWFIFGLAGGWSLKKQ
jgi:nitric oxide reductase subunit B